MNYLYNPDSPPSGVSLNLNGAVREILLFPGKVVDMPADNDYTRVLLAEGHLLAVPATPVTAAAKASKKGVTNEQPES